MSGQRFLKKSETKCEMFTSRKQTVGAAGEKSAFKSQTVSHLVSESDVYLCC